MKKTLLLTCLCFVFIHTKAQIFKPATSTANYFSDSLTNIVVDFAFNFKNIQGESLPGEVDADVFQSKIGLPGAQGCMIKRYHSVLDNTASWQCTMYSGDSYEEAAAAYKKVFSQVKHARLKGIGSSAANFEGEMEKADENVRFAVSSLRMKTTDWHYANLVADVELTSSYGGWEVHLNLYYKSRDTDGPTQ